MRRALIFLAMGALYAAPVLAQAPPVSPINQAFKALVVTPNDSTDLPNGPTLGLFNGNATACILALLLVDDSVSALWQNVQSGSVLPARVRRVLSTGTTCSNLLALYPH